ncbi:hypothetical protein A9Q90_07405 [Gammaproteobacteria bacterium 54_18_T64]|nr:hypothetical protein A9Q90_07405 [Gammaproteobacteria bacterium 54_18_T64]
MLGFATLLSLFCVLGGALSFRFGLLPFGLSFTTYGLGLLACGLLTLTLGALIARRLARKQDLAKLPLYLLLCAAPVAVVVNQVGPAGFQRPAIHDISTDLLQPPVFVFAQAERGAGENSLQHGGQALAEQQRQGYPHLAALHLSATRADVWTAAQAVIANNNWRLLGEDKSRGHIEAAATTPLMGFTDDMVIRISAAPVSAKASENKIIVDVGARENPPAKEHLIVDVRSVSRVGVSDLGANAARIEGFLKDVQKRLNN